jgi:hypothetical protein
MKPQDLDSLIEDCLENRLSEADAHRLSVHLALSAEARARYWETASLHGMLEHSLQNASLHVVTGQASPTSVRGSRWIAWRSLTAAAAGLVIGLLSASVVFGYVVPFTRSLNLLEESFEEAAVVAAKIALEPGVWRGDHAVVVGAEQTVKPLIGGKMLRFLRPDFQGKTRPAGGHIADVYRLIDLRDFRQDFSNGEVVVQASASVNAIPFSEQEKFGCAISLFALDAESLPVSPSYLGTALESEANAMTRSNRTKLDRDPSSWQRLTTEMRLPANTEFLVVRLHINQNFESDGSSIFTGSYADDVRVTLTHRRLLP